MNKKNTAVSVKNVSKDFKIPHEQHDSIKSKFLNVFKRNVGYSTKSALKDVSFEIQEGEFFGIVGRNGSGKSTLLKIIAEIYQPTGGSVSIHGKLVPFIELGVGFNPKLTGRENVYLNGAILGQSRKQIDSNYQQIVDFAELEEFMDLELKNYSSGMQVRLAFACATTAKADILLVDEVLAVGDMSFQRKCFEYFKQLKQQGTTVIFVSHNMEQVREFCDRAVLIDNSQVVEIGETNKISQLYSRLFLNISKENVLRQTGERWGEGGMEILRVKPNRSTYKDKDKDVEIEVRVRSELKVNDNYKIGFVVKNKANQNIVGINSALLNQPLPSLEKNGETVLSWKLSNIFKPGTYSITVAVESNDGVTYDWWNQAAEFEVKKEILVSYVVQPDIELTIA